MVAFVHAERFPDLNLCESVAERLLSLPQSVQQRDGVETHVLVADVRVSATQT